MQIINLTAAQPAHSIGHGREKGKVAREFVFFDPDGKAMEEALGAAVNMGDFFLVDNGGFAGYMPVGIIG